MKPLAFISYSDSGGIETSRVIEERLKRSKLDIESFRAKSNIQPSDDSHEQIIRNIVNADILIAVIDQDALESPWVKWEVMFAKNRNLIHIPIIFTSVWDDFVNNRIDFLRNNRQAIHYNYDKDILLDSLFTAVKNKKIELHNRANNKEKIQITLEPLKDFYQSKDVIIISGQVKSTEPDLPEFSRSKIYLYSQNFEQHGTPIINTTLTDSISIDSSGRFSHKYELSEIPNTDKEQELFLEIQFEEQSKIAVVKIRPQNRNTSDTLLSKTPSSSPAQHSPCDFANKKIKSISLGTVSSIDKKIKGYTIDRNPVLSKLIEAIKKNNKIVITGDKGSGKSVILCHLYNQLKENNDILFVRCDDYLNIQHKSELEAIVSESESLYEIVQECYETDNKLLVFFDSLDTISRNSRVFEFFKQFLKQLWGTGKVKTVCSARIYDYEYSISIRSTDWGMQFNIAELSDKQLNLTLEHLCNPKISEELRPILRNPLNLRLLSQILESGTNDLRSITSEIDLYNEHWREYVEKSNDPKALRKVLFEVSKEMIEKHQTTITTPGDCSLKDLKLAKSSSLLLHDSDTNTIQFFHHAYLDYVASRYMLENYNNLDEFIIQQKYNVFLRPTITFTLAILRMKNEELFLNNVQRLLSSDEIQYYWKLSTLDVFVDFKSKNPSKIDVFGELFNKNLYLRRHFLQKSTELKKSFWFEIWKNSFIRDWSAELHTNNKFLLEYFESVSQVVEHSKLFELLRTVVSKNSRAWTRKTAVEIASGLNVEKSDWYLELSKNENSDVRWGVVESLPNLAEGKTKNLSKIFSNIFLFKEKSEDKTIVSLVGSLALCSNKQQDNMHVIWAAGECFGELLNKRPAEFLSSVVTIIESEQKGNLKPSDAIVEDWGYIWYESSSDRSIGKNKLLSDTEEFLATCNVTKLKQLISIFTKTKFATLHKIAISAMLKKKDSFVDEIFAELSIPEIYKIQTLESIVQTTIKDISPFLSAHQSQVILKQIMGISVTENQSNKETQGYIKPYQIKLLSSVPSDKLSTEQKNLLGKYPQEMLQESPQSDIRPVKISTMPHGVEKSPEEIIDAQLGQNLDREQKIELLYAILEYLASDTEKLDPQKLLSLKNFLMLESSNKDPQESVKDEDSSHMVVYRTVRGTVSRCLVRLYYHTKDVELIEYIENLSKDSINIVRADVIEELRYLYSVNPSLTLKIVTRHSQESDIRIQLYLHGIVPILGHKYPQETINIIKNIIQMKSTKNDKFFHLYAESVVFLALHKQNPTAKSMLYGLMSNPDISDKYKENIPFILKESYLYNKSTQGEALEIFSTLLDSKSSHIREKATFFLLVTLKGETPKIKQVVEKIGPHLDKIATEIERKTWDLRIVEALVEFLEKYWETMQEKSLEYLQRISNDEQKHLEFQPRIARGIVMILNGLFREGSLGDADRQLCLDILDKFAMAGWPEALNLLNSMERPD